MKMRFFAASVILTILCLEVTFADKKKLQIGVKKKVENCERRSKKGDVLKMHYTVLYSELKSHTLTRPRNLFIQITMA